MTFPRETPLSEITDLPSRLRTAAKSWNIQTWGELVEAYEDGRMANWKGVGEGTVGWFVRNMRGIEFSKAAQAQRDRRDGKKSHTPELAKSFWQHSKEKPEIESLHKRLEFMAIQLAGGVPDNYNRKRVRDALALFDLADAVKAVDKRDA